MLVHTSGVLLPVGFVPHQSVSASSHVDFGQVPSSENVRAASCWVAQGVYACRRLQCRPRGVPSWKVASTIIVPPTDSGNFRGGCR